MHVPRSFLDELIPARGRKMLFVHPPKCGGKFVERAFGKRARNCISVRHPNLQGHLFWTEYRDRMRALGDSVDSYYTFSVMRNPFAWRVSFYEYVRKDTGGRHSGLPHLHALWSKMTFSDYLDWLEDPAAPTTVRFRPRAQVSDWFTNEEGIISVDYVLRQEVLTQDLSRLGHSFGIRLRIPDTPVNRSVSGDWRRYYSSGDVDKVAALHQRDIALFKYSFE